MVRKITDSYYIDSVKYFYKPMKVIRTKATKPEIMLH